MKCDRRKFLKIASLSSVATISGGTSAFISSCTRNGINPLTSIDIVSQECIGCGECLPSCHYDAIKLPNLTQYSIDIDECTECAKCMDVCKEDAIFIVKSEYSIVEENCVGCGDCIDECELEGDCISYERDYYFVRGRCKANRCHLQCVVACNEHQGEENCAITVQNGKAIIDMEKCDRCGDCIAACPYDAINPAKVVIDQDNCNNCGKCLRICDFEAVQKTSPDNYAEPYIDMNICTSCGDCIDLEGCPDFDAISRDIQIAEISRTECRDCGNCLDFCRFDAIIRNY